RMRARVGQHSGSEPYELLNVTPWSTRSALTSGMAHRVSHRWSSVRMNTMFGAVDAGRLPGTCPRAGPAMKIIRTAPAEASATALREVIFGGVRSQVRSLPGRDRGPHEMDGRQGILEVVEALIVGVGVGVAGGQRGQAEGVLHVGEHRGERGHVVVRVSRDGVG